MLDIEQCRVETFQCSFSRKPGKFCMLFNKSGDTYTAARAVVKLGALSIKELGTISKVDLKNLIDAYQYFYGERFSFLFSKTHETLWSYFNSQSDVRNLLTLFRHSSFIWRLHGDETKEKTYVQELSDNAR